MILYKQNVYVLILAIMFIHCFILFVFLILIDTKNPKYFCKSHQNSDIHLNSNEITFVETINFTNIAGFLDDSTSPCSFSFYLEPSSKNKKFVFVVTNPLLLDLFNVTNNQSIISWNNLNYELRFNLHIRYEFQGFVIHDELNYDNECFAESVIPYYFEDDTQILYIRSSYFEITRRNRSCKWEFRAPNGYGFKIVIAELNITSDITLAVTNSTNYYIINKHSAVTYKPYYNEDNNLFVYLSRSNTTFNSPRIEFGASISIVKRNFTTKDANCAVTTNSDYITWTNINYNNPTGYSNNAKCTYDLEIFSNTLIVATNDGYRFSLEDNVDTLSYYDEDTKSYYNFFDDHFDGKVFLPYENGTQKTVSWEFKSDGSIAYGGFTIVFWRIYCFCATPIWIVSCDEADVRHLYITNTTNNDYSTYIYTYCGNLKCNFTIQSNSSCPNKHIGLEVVLSSDQLKVNDKFRFISDNETIFVINSTNRNLGLFEIIYNSNSVNIFEAITENVQFSIPRMISAYLSSLNEPKLKRAIILTKENTYAVIDFRQYISGDYVSIEIENISELKNAYIEIYAATRTAKSHVQYYTDEKLKHLLTYNDDCFINNLLYCRTSTQKVYALLFRDTLVLDATVLLFQIAPKELIGGCLLHPNVFMISFFFPISAISAIAGPSGVCKVFLLNDSEYYSMPKIWTTASKNNVKVFTGHLNETLIFEFNEKTAAEWQNIKIRSIFFAFEIPINSSIFITIDQVNEIPDKIEANNYKSFIQAPYYPIIPNEATNCFTNFTIEKNIFVTFNITYLNVSPTMIFHFYSNNTLQNLEKVGKVLTLRNTKISMCYFNGTVNKNSAPDDPGFIILLDVKTIQ